MPRIKTAVPKAVQLGQALRTDLPRFPGLWDTQLCCHSSSAQDTAVGRENSNSRSPEKQQHLEKRDTSERVEPRAKVRHPHPRFQEGEQSSSAPTNEVLCILLRYFTGFS